MRVIDVIFSIVWDIAWFFWEIRYEIRGVPIVGPALAALFYEIFALFMDLATQVARFGDWVNDISTKILEVVTLTSVWDYFKEYFQAAQFAWAWVLDAFTYVTQWTVEWWASNSIIVQSWIAIATQGFSELVVAWDNFWTVTWPELLSVVNTLSTAWDYFWTVTLPTLVSFTWLTTWWNARLMDIQALINTAFTLREGLWAGWQEWRDQVTEFFTDPEDWLYKAVDRIIERFW